MITSCADVISVQITLVFPSELVSENIFNYKYKSRIISVGINLTINSENQSFRSLIHEKVNTKSSSQCYFKRQFYALLSPSV